MREFHAAVSANPLIRSREDANLCDVGHKADERGSLTKIPETFDRLIKEKGTLGAVRAVVGLLMGEGQGVGL